VNAFLRRSKAACCSGPHTNGTYLPPSFFVILVNVVTTLEYLYESSVKVGKPKETLNIGDSPRNLPSQDAGYLLLIHPDSLGGDDETQIFHLLFVNMALFLLQVQSGIRQCFQHLIYLFPVFLQGIAVNKDVVEKRGTKVVKVGSEHIVYEGLEVRRCVR